MGSGASLALEVQDLSEQIPGLALHLRGRLSQGERTKLQELLRKAADDLELDPPEKCQKTEDLKDYFEKFYVQGGCFEHPEYEESDEWTWLHKPTGIRVWRDAIALTRGSGGTALFHYTGELPFDNITHPAKEAAEIWASLRTEGPTANAWWGRGVYTVPLPPDGWRDRHQLLDNNFRNMMRRDEENKGKEFVEQEYPPRAAFCVPMIVSPGNAYDVSVRATPEMVAAGKPPGENLAGKLLNEPGMPSRTCVVVQVSGAEGIKNAQGHVLEVLRARAHASRNLQDLDRLGDVLHKRGLYHEALPILQGSLHRNETEHGEDHPTTLESINRLALLLQDMGNYSEAESLHRKALNLCEKTLGLEHPETLISLNNLAFFLRKVDKYDEALSLSRRALDAHEQVLGKEHRKTLFAANNLGCVLLSKGWWGYEEAEHLLRSVLQSRTKILGEEHPDTLISVNNLASFLRRTRNFSEAESLYRRALQVREKSLGHEHPNTLNSVYNLAACLFDRNERSQAVALARRAVEAAERVLGMKHPHTLLYANATFNPSAVSPGVLPVERRPVEEAAHPCSSSAVSTLLVPQAEIVELKPAAHPFSSNAVSSQSVLEAEILYLKPMEEAAHPCSSSAVSSQLVPQAEIIELKPVKEAAHPISSRAVSSQSVLQAEVLELKPVEETVSPGVVQEVEILEPKSKEEAAHQFHGDAEILGPVCRSAVGA